MFDLFKKGLLAGLGAAVITREKVMERTNRLVEEGKLTAEEAERLAGELVDSGEEQWQEVREDIRQTVRQALDSMDIGSRKEFEDLKTGLAAIEQRLTIIEERLSGSGQE